MAYIAMAYIATAYIVMAYVVMAYVVMAHTVMACVHRAYPSAQCRMLVWSTSTVATCLSPPFDLDPHTVMTLGMVAGTSTPVLSFEVCTCLQTCVHEVQQLCGLCSYGLCSYGLYSYGRGRRVNLRSATAIWPIQ